MSEAKHYHKRSHNMPRGATMTNQQPKVRYATEKDVKTYHKLCAEVIKHNYLLESAGLHKDDFDEEKFFSKDMDSYFKKLLQNNEHQKTLVIELDGNVIGGITIKKHAKQFELVGLTISPDHQGKGLGLRLIREADKLIGKHTVIAHEFANAGSAVNTYFVLKFVINPKNGVKSLRPDWLKHNKSLLQYSFVRPTLLPSSE